MLRRKVHATLTTVDHDCAPALWRRAQSAVPADLVPGSGLVSLHIHFDLHESIMVSTGGRWAMDMLENQFTITVSKYILVSRR